MNKVILLLASSLWLSCGNQVKTSENTTAEVKENTEVSVQSPVQIIVSDTTAHADAMKIEEAVSKEMVETETAETVEIMNKPADEVQMVVDKKEEKKEPEITPDAPDTVITETKMAAKKEEVKMTEVDDMPKEVIEKPMTIPDHANWNRLLKKYVTSGGDVDYKGFLNDIDALQAYLAELAENDPENSWSKKEKLAYYINLYNAATVKLILDNFPVKSIKDINKPWGKAWVKIGDSKLSLGDIEHKILRKMNEPRIHFAINCASYSCPKLLNEAFTASKMEAQLQATTKDFINDTKRNKISANKVELSNIFKWYKKDFTDNGSLIDYMNPYTSVEISRKAAIGYLKYDWSLNEAK